MLTERELLVDIRDTLARVHALLEVLAAPTIRLNNERDRKTERELQAAWLPFMDHGLGMRAFNVLVRYKVWPEEVKEMTDRQLRRWPGLGRGGIQQIRSAQREADSASLHAGTA